MNEVTVLIRLDANGAMQISTPVRDKIYVLGLLEAAKNAVLSAAQAPAIVPIHQPVPRLNGNGG